MGYHFCNEQHEQRFYAMLARDQTGSGDRERKAMFYILSGNPELYDHVPQIYNYQAHRLCPNSSDKLGYMCSSSRKLLKLSIHLYNSYAPCDQTPYDFLGSLDSQNLDIALNGMRLRFS